MAWLPVPLFGAATFLVWVADLRGVYESPDLLLVLNFVFSTLATLLAAYLLGRSFLIRAAPGVLVLGCGAVTWALAGVVGSVVAHGDVETHITIQNTGACLAAAWHLAGVILMRRPRRAARVPGLWLTAGYALGLGAVGLVAELTLAGRMPTFFVQGHGGTPVRQVLLGAAIAMFGVAAVLFRTIGRRPPTQFARWYSLGVALFAIGLCGTMFQTTHGNALSWIGRGAQYAAGVYVLFAALASVRESRVWGSELGAALRESEERFAVLSAATFEGIAVTEGGRFIDVNEQLLEMIGRRREEVIGAEVAFLIPPEHRERVLGNIRSGRESVTEHPVLRKDGSVITVEAHGRTVALHDRSIRLTAIRDISAQQRADRTIRRQNAVLRGINRIFEAAMASATVEDLGRVCLEVAEEATDSKFGFIGEIGDDGLLHDIALSDPGWEACRMMDARGQRRPPGFFRIHGIYGRVLRDGKSLLTNAPDAHPDRIGLPPGHPPLTAFLGVPLVSDRSTTGMIAMANRPGGYTADQLETLEALAPAVTAAFGRRRAEERLAADLVELKRAEESLHLSEERFALALRAAQEGVWDWNVETGAVIYSARYKEMLGYAEDELAPHFDTWDGLLHPEDRARAHSVLDAVLRGEREFDMEFRLQCKDGHYVDILSRGAPVRREPNGPIVRVVGTHLDISERRRAEEDLRQMRDYLDNLFNYANAPIIVWDPALRITRFNHAFERLTGRKADEVLGGDIGVLFPESAREAALAHIRRTSAGGERWEVVEIPILRVGGEVRTVLWNSANVMAPDGSAIVATIAQGQDITERKQLEEEREALLSSERAARGEAERASQMKDDFVAVLSHELRNPLNAILGWAQLLRRSRDLPAEAVEGIDVIQSNGRILADMVSDLLDVSRITAGKLRLDVRVVDLLGVVRAVVDAVRPAAEAKGINLELAGDDKIGPVRGDPQRLQQIVWNLLSNAVKFTDSGGAVGVEVRRLNGQVEIRVSDNGRGIDPAFLPHLFKRFQQADVSAARRHGGLGLGLSIVASLVELHGGGVRAASPGRGQGATFTVTLPTLTGKAPDAASATARPRGPVAIDFESITLEGVKVLVVDDQREALEMVKRVLEERRAVVFTAASAIEGFALLEQNRPDVLISDIGMPSEDGYELLRRVRVLPIDRGGATPAVALTALAGTEDRQRAMACGYQAHVPKPVDVTQLIATVAGLVGRIVYVKPLKRLDRDTNRGS